MFLEGNDLKNWPEIFIKIGSLYQNEFKVIYSQIRGKSALIVTIDTGSNKFRSWKNEVTVW